MSEEFSFDIDLDEIDKLEVLDKMQKELEARHQRFMNGTETIDDLINGIYHYKIKNNDGLDLDVVETKYYNKIIDLYNKEKMNNFNLSEQLNKEKEKNNELQVLYTGMLQDWCKEKGKNKELEEYANWHIEHLTEDIADYIDDDRKANANLIGELKEEREHWKDIIRISNNENTYIDYKNY